MKLSLLKTVRARLLALMTFIIIPIAILSITIASINYRSTTKSIRSSHIEETSNYAVRARIWFRGALRALTLTALSVQTAEQDETTCKAALRNVVDSANGFQAIQIRRTNNSVCFASSPENFTSDILSKIADEQANLQPSRTANASDQFKGRYDSYTIDGKVYFTITIRGTQEFNDIKDAIALIDPNLLDRVFDIGHIKNGSIVALMKGTNEILVARGLNESDTSWLPTNWVQSNNNNQYWQSYSKDGGKFTYAKEVIAEPDINILSRFTGEAAIDAYVQFIILCVMPLLILIILFVTYAWTIQSDVIKWIRGIEAAARGRDAYSSRLAPIDNAMPEDIRAVAEAFNSMVTEADKRESALRTMVDANSFLTRELNHRVKNSLQVIQSYLALSRRQHGNGPTEHLAETEAKVQVLSTAYRLALQDGVMRPVSIKPFCEEILEGVASSLRRKEQWIDIRIDTTSGLVVDHVIALGLVLVEGAVAGIRAVNCTKVTVKLRELDDGYLQLNISTDGQRESSLPPAKIMAGLAAQVNAKIMKTDDGEIINWIFKP